MARSSLPPSPVRSRDSIPASPRSRGLGGSLDAREEAPPLFSSLPEAGAFVTLCGVLIAAPTYFSGFWPVSHDYWPQSLALLAALLATLLLALSGSGAARGWKISPLSGCVLGFAACNVASLLAASYRHDALLEASRLVAALAWFPIARRLLFAPTEASPSAQVLAAGASNERKRLCLVVGSAAAGTLVACALAVARFAAERQPQMASFYNTNLFAFCVAMSLPLCAAAWLLARPLVPGRAVDALGAAGVLLGAAGLLVSASKGGLIAGLCGSLAFAALAWSARRGAVASTWRAHRRVLGPVLLVVALALGGLGARTVLPRLQRATGSESHSAVFRAYTWRGTLAMANASPLVGHGPGSFASEFPRFQQAGYTRSAHQSWLQIAAESGWASLLFLLGATGCGLARAIKYLGDAARPHRAWVGAGCAGALVAGLVHGMMDAGWGLLSIAMLFAVCLALLDAPADKSSAPEAAEIEARPLSLGWLLAVLPLAAAASYGLKAQGAENAHVSGRDIAAMSEGQRAEAMRQAAFATEDAPLDARAWANLALLKEATGDAAGAAGDYRQASRLQPGKALYPRRLAELFEGSKSPSQAREFFDKAVVLEPKDTSLRLERAQFRAKSGDAKGAREDYQAILDLQESPLGLYPATPEIVNGDFNRARLALARDASSSGDSKLARVLAERGLQEAQAARASAKANALMIEAVTMYGDVAAPPRQSEIDEQERAFKTMLSSQP